MNREDSSVTVIVQFVDLQNNKLRNNKPPLSQLWTGAVDADSVHQHLMLIQTS